MNPKQTFLRALSLSTAITALLGVAPKDASANRAEAVNTGQAASEPQTGHSRRKFVLTRAPQENTEPNLHLAGHGSHSSHSSHASGSTGGGDYTPPPTSKPPNVSPTPPTNPVAPPTSPPPTVASPPVSTAPSIPGGLLTIPRNASVILFWDEVSDALTYNVKRATNPQGPYLLITNCSDPKFTDDKLQNGLTYYYVVSALNAYGESDNSNHIGATPNGPVVASQPSPVSPAPSIAPAASTKPSPSTASDTVSLLSAANLVGVSDGDLVIMRNTPYARHGYSFPGVKPKTISLRRFFKAKPWYKPDTDNEEVAYSKLSPNERANIDLIVRTEKKRHPDQP